MRDDFPAVQSGAPDGCGQQCAAWHAEPPVNFGQHVQYVPQGGYRAAIDILDRLGIAEHAPKRAEAMSGGQQQRIAIARALMQDPKIILADEPIASLDPMNAQIVMETLRRIHEEDGRTVIANLHTLDTARRYCDRVIGMRAGRIVFDGTPEQLTTNMAREIYGAGPDFSEAATSTAIETLDQTLARLTA